MRQRFDELDMNYQRLPETLRRERAALHWIQARTETLIEQGLTPTDARQRATAENARHNGQPVAIITPAKLERDRAGYYAGRNRARIGYTPPPITRGTLDAVRQANQPSEKG